MYLIFPLTNEESTISLVRGTMATGGLVLLVLASLVSRTFAKWFGWGSVAALVALSGGQIFASVSGLASGALAPTGSAVAIVIVSIVVFDLVIVGLAVLGIVLIRRLFRRPEPAAQQD